ncbi:polysaccharide biosynthesis tyrosine autokinase [Arthrobacter sunyaminii]|uniref:polysaccharide biosynthesis tyrosine autokinase n=1 Tax=Arthrobacter sunyaminii TaxID=2816859 RepID=UPI001A93AD14|nr:polysaccharide biosynthesis tyrosine autokinase [Arthrobacter sunyaminii]MBO0896449.1 polysaccharide biosynthesis tyrosine autokinase [Arthrobacter sunyaminii]
MDLRDVLTVLHRNWITILVCALTGVLALAATALMATPTYTASTRLFVAIQNTGTISELQMGNSFSQARVQSYVETARTPVVLQPVIDELGLEISAKDLSKNVSASADLSTVLITLSANSDSPVQAAAIAQAMAASLVNAVTDLESSDQTPEWSPVKLSIVEPATAPQSPSSPNTPLMIVAGLFAGTAVGIIYSLLRKSLDSKIRSVDDIKRVSTLPLLGGIVLETAVAKKPLITQVGYQSPRAESFRQIRTNLQFAHVDSRSKTTLVTSSVPGEGKSTIAANLAIALAQAGQRVALVDGDLRRPTIANYLGLESGAGLTTALLGDVDVADLLQPWGEDQLYVLTSGKIPPNPSELLGSEAMRALVVRLEAEFDAVIIDAPPLLPVTDASILAQVVGGVVMVVGTRKIGSRDFEKSLQSLDFVEANVLGLVVNFLPSKGPDAYASSYYSNESVIGPDKTERHQPDQVSGSHLATRRHSRKTRNSFEGIVR